MTVNIDPCSHVCLFESRPPPLQTKEVIMFVLSLKPTKRGFSKKTRQPRMRSFLTGWAILNLSTFQPFIATMATNSLIHTVDGRTPAPPKNHWNDDSAAITDQHWLSHGFKVLRTDFVHPLYPSGSMATLRPESPGGCRVTGSAPAGAEEEAAPRGLPGAGGRGLSHERRND